MDPHEIGGFRIGGSESRLNPILGILGITITFMLFNYILIILV